MQIFRNIAPRPWFSGNVTKLVYDGRLFIPELAIFKCHKEKLSLVLPGEEIDEESMDPFSMDRNYPLMSSYGCEMHGDGFCETAAYSLVAYTQLLAQQQRILDKAEDFTALSKRPPSFRNLTKAII